VSRSRVPLRARVDPRRGPGYRSRWYRFGALVLRPILFAITKRDWQGSEHIPRDRGAIVAVNHLSYADPLVFAHFLFDNGFTPRFLGKSSLFRLPIIGRVLLGAGQIPVERETSNAREAFDAAVDAVERGETLGIYPEATLTRDPELWPMVGKTGIARIALRTGAPVIPCAQWGAQAILAPYGRKPHLWPRTLVRVHAGPALDLSPWKGREDQQALEEVTALIMSTITGMLEVLRGEPAPTERFDPRKAGVARIGNFRKQVKKKR
jgi:1-acyl-sn-glycerol-3-phosphate acyltransferase